MTPATLLSLLCFQFSLAAVPLQQCWSWFPFSLYAPRCSRTQRHPCPFAGDCRERSWSARLHTCARVQRMSHSRPAAALHTVASLAPTVLFPLHPPLFCAERCAACCASRTRLLKQQCFTVRCPTITSCHLLPSSAPLAHIPSASPTVPFLDTSVSSEQDQ